MKAQILEGKILTLLLDASNEAGLEIHTEKSKHKSMSCYQNAGQNCNMMTAPSP